MLIHELVEFTGRLAATGNQEYRHTDSPHQVDEHVHDCIRRLDTASGIQPDTDTVRVKFRVDTLASMLIVAVLRWLR
ncbi:MAG: hypothetical protein ABI867_38435 [Kofleriaceae bacterium]